MVELNKRLIVHLFNWIASAAMVLMLVLVSFCLDEKTAIAGDGGAISTGVDAAQAVDVGKRPVKDKWALVIGISQFQDASINLKYPAKDAKDFQKYLISEANFAPDHVKLLLNEDATRERILAEVGDKWLPHRAGPDDLVVIYISSHGSPSMLDVAGVNYLVAYNTDKESLYATGIPIQDLSRMVKERVHSDRVVLFLDACHSGAAEIDSKGLYRQMNFNASQIAESGGSLVVCSSQPNQIAWESKEYPNGVFTHYLIEGLRQKGKDTTLGEAFTFMQSKVQDEVLRDRGELQTPVLKSKWEGKGLALAILPAEPRTGLLGAGTESLSEGSPLQTLPPGRDQSVSPSSSEPAARSKRADPRDGIAGTWESNWGPTTFIHKAIEDDLPVSVTGYWQQSAKHRGIFKSGTYDPVKGIVNASYYQGWNFMHGKARLQLMPDGTLKGEAVHLGFAWHFPWLLWRAGSRVVP